MRHLTTSFLMLNG